MVVEPKALMNQIQEDERKIVERLEKKIDDSIRKAFDGRGSCVYNFDADCQALRPFVLEGLLDRYRTQGWSSVRINYWSDPRDMVGGRYIEFKYRTGERPEISDGYR